MWSMQTNTVPEVRFGGADAQLQAVLLLSDISKCFPGLLVSAIQVLGRLGTSAHVGKDDDLATTALKASKTLSTKFMTTTNLSRDPEMTEKAST